MALPTITVEFAFGSTWLDDPAGLTWTDVSSYVKTMESLGTIRGRSTELDLFSAGQASFMLDSPSRRFDPLNAAGPYYGDLVPGVPVRITAETEPLFYGYVDSWKNIPGTHLGSVAVQATDAFRKLAGLTLRSAYEYEVLSDDPEVYFTLDGADPSNVLADSSGNRYDGLFTTAARDGGVIRPYALGSAIADPPDVNIGRSDRVLSDWDPVTAEFWIKGSADLDRINFCLHACVGGGSNNWFYVLSYPPPTISGFGGEVVVRIGHLGDTYYFYANLQDGNPHHVVMVFDSTAPDLVTAGFVRPRKVVIYVDGVESNFYQVISGSPASSFAKPGITFGTLAASTADNLLEGALSDVAIYPGQALTADQVTAHYATATRPWDGDTTGERIERILDIIGWPASLRDIDPGETSCGVADPVGSTALDYLQTVAETEGGRLFISADGKITFHDAGRMVSGTSAYTFTDDGTGTGILVGGLTFSLDDTFVYDAAEIQRVGGSVQRAGSSTPTRVYSKTGLLFRTDAQSRNLAERIAFRFSTPQTRAEEFTVSLNQHNTAEWAAVLGLEIGDVITVEMTPQGVGDPLSLDLFIEQITHESSGDSWRSTFYGARTGQAAAYLICDTTDPDEYLEAGALR